MKNVLNFDKWKQAASGVFLLGAAMACGQTGMSARLIAGNPYAGSATTAAATGNVIPLSMDDAIQRGLQHNLAVVIAQQNQRVASGQQLQELNQLLPNLSLTAVRRRNQINLAALGFRPSTLAKFPPSFFHPGAKFGPVVTVNVVNAQVNLQQSLFNVSAFEAYRAQRESRAASYYSLQSARGLVILNVATTYLQALADAANVDNAKALLDADSLLAKQVKDAVEAGTGTHLDQLRAQLQQQQQQQAVINSQRAFEKDKIALNRQIGLAAEQPIRLTDVTPYAELELASLDQAKLSAYANRQDYQGMQAQARASAHVRNAARWERLPSLSFQGNDGVTGTVGGIYHGTFMARGELTVPIFREASLRGDRDVAEAQRLRALAQLEDLRTKIDAQLRDNLLDVTAAKQLVDVATSNAELAQQSLSDAMDRFKNGVSDNLPVVQAQAVLAAAQAQRVNSLENFNLAKLGLARNMGVIEAQYRAYLGPASLAPAESQSK